MSELQIQVTEGRAWETTKKLTPGTPLGPMGVGSGAEWVIDGQGIAPVHAYLYFDGNALMVATVPPSVTTLNGAQVGGDWTPVRAPAEVRIGSARLYINYSGVEFEDAATTNVPPKEMDDAATGFFDKGASQGPGPAQANPAAGRRPPPADESTAFMPIEQMRKAEQTSPAGPAPGQPAVVVSPEAYKKKPDPSKIAMTIAPGIMPTPQIEPPPQPQPQQPPQAAPAAKEGFWATASVPRKITIVLAPIALIAFATTLFDDPPAPQKTGNKKAAASASASGAASASAPPPSPIGALPDLPVGPLLPAAPRDSGAKKPPFPPTKPPPPTLERKAVDAAIAGNYAEAIALYEQLSQQYPQVPVYKEALRILKAKQAK